MPFANHDDARQSLGTGPLAQAWVADLDERTDGLYPRFDADVLVRVMAEVAEPRWLEWESITVPTLVIYADGGMFADAQKSEFVARGKNVARVDLVGASHDAHLDAFEQWIEALRGFTDAP